MSGEYTRDLHGKNPTIELKTIRARYTIATLGPQKVQKNTLIECRGEQGLGGETVDRCVNSVRTDTCRNKPISPTIEV